MALDPSIILSGRPIDFAGSMADGNALAAQTHQIQDQNALREVFRTQGANIMAGNPQGLNSLAAIDPSAALGIQGARLDMKAQQQRMDILSRDEQRQIDEFNAKASAAEKAAAAQEIEDAVKMGLAIPDAATWDSVMAQQAPDLVGRFNNRQAIAMKYMSMAEALKVTQPEAPQWRAATPEEAAAYGAAAGQINGKTGEFKPFNPPKGTSLSFDPTTGAMSFADGVGAPAVVKFTEAQTKDNVFATRAEGALSAFEPVAGALTSRAGSALDSVPLGLGRGMQSDEYQLASQSGREFLAAILRKDTGAAITPQEMSDYGSIYLPQPGDGAAVQEAKRAARIRAVEAIKSGMNADQIAAKDRALISSAASGSGASNPPPDAGQAPAGFEDIWNKY